MARILEEFFEATGYDETGWTESVPGSCVVDEDDDSANAGSPPLWGSQCLKFVLDGAGANCYSYNNSFGDGALRYYALEFKISSTGFTGDGQQAGVGAVYNAALSASKFLFQLIRSGGLNYLQLWVNDAGTGFSAKYAIQFSLNTLYRIEAKWDGTGNTWELWVNNDAAGSGSLTGASAGTSSGSFILGDILTANEAHTFRVDRVEVDDANRIYGWVQPLSGSADMVMDDGASTLVGSGALAGAANLTFDDGTSQLSGSGALAGQLDMQIGADGSLDGAGALLGQADLVFDDGASALRGDGALAGQADLLFSVDGAVDQFGLLAGAAGMSFDLLGDLVNGAMVTQDGAVWPIPGARRRRRLPEDYERERRMIERYLSSLERIERERAAPPGRMSTTPDPVLPDLSPAMLSAATSEELGKIAGSTAAPGDDRAVVEMEKRRRIRAATAAVLLLTY